MLGRRSCRASVGAPSRNLCPVNRGTETVGLTAPEAQAEPAGGERPAPAIRARRASATTPRSTACAALAVLSVIAYHDDYAWAKGGFLGVDMFFVLSGFLITTLLMLEFRRGVHDRGSARSGRRRARRLLPALLLVLVFVAIYIALAVVPWERNGDPRRRVREPLLRRELALHLRPSSATSSCSRPPSPLRHMWSLAIEEQFYLVWPLVVFACLRIGRGLDASCSRWSCARRRARRRSSSMALRFHPGDPSRAYYGTDARAHTILIGALLARSCSRVAAADRGPAASSRLGAIPAIVVVLVRWTHSCPAPSPPTTTAAPRSSPSWSRS